MDELSSYRHINASEIVQANVNTNQVGSKLGDLIKVLSPLHIALKSNWSNGSTLRRDIKEKLSSKRHTLALLVKVGFEDDGQGNYVFRECKTDRERQDRQDVAEEIGRLLRYLTIANTNSLVNFENDLRTSLSNSLPVNRRNHSRERLVTHAQRSSWHESISQPILLDVTRVKDDNERTQTVIRTLKESFNDEHGFPATPTFIRRKIAMLQLRQHPTLRGVDESFIDQMVGQLKLMRTNKTISISDDVYVECLIRSEFKVEKALHVINSHRLNLTPPVTETVVNEEGIHSAVDQANTVLTQHWQALRGNFAETNPVPNLSEEATNWRGVKHLVHAIIQLRKTHQNQNVDDSLLSKMYRLLFSELSKRIDRQMEINIEMIAGILCELTMNNLDNLDVPTIRSLYTLSLDGYFVENAKQLFSNECPICAGTFPRSQIETMFLCDHMCCLDCLKDYYRSVIPTIQDMRSLNQLTCFHEAHEITIDTKLYFFQSLESKLNQWFRDDRTLIELYLSKIFHATRDAQIKKCGNPQCTSSFYIGPNDQRVRVNCPDCHFAQCQQCGQKWNPEHAIRTCEEYLTWLEEEDPDNPDVQARQYLRSTMIVCPNQACGHIFQFVPGQCEHFKCRACQTDFCRICSTIFVNPASGTECLQPNCQIRSLHAHCRLNCFREVRDASPETFIHLLEENEIDIVEDFGEKPISTDGKCPVDECGRPSSELCQHRFCETCYKEFLWSYVWNNEIEPWDLYEANNLVQVLTKAAIQFPSDATKEQLIEIAHENLNELLGKPRT